MFKELPRAPIEDGAADELRSAGAFEAALRRDLATTPVVSYDSVLGGAAKRGFDVALVCATAPLWAPLLVFAWAWLKFRGRVWSLQTETCVGYGGRHFALRTLDVRPSAGQLVTFGAPANDRRPSRLTLLVERLPQFLSVLHGEMSLVGPAPTTPRELGALKGAMRYYLSARPGLVGVSGAQCRAYARDWSLGADIAMLWRALRGARLG